MNNHHNHHPHHLVACTSTAYLEDPFIAPCPDNMPPTNAETYNNDTPISAQVIHGFSVGSPWLYHNHEYHRPFSDGPPASSTVLDGTSVPSHFHHHHSRSIIPIPRDTPAGLANSSSSSSPNAHLVLTAYKARRSESIIVNSPSSHLSLSPESSGAAYSVHGYNAHPGTSSSPWIGTHYSDSDSSPKRPLSSDHMRAPEDYKQDHFAPTHSLSSRSNIAISYNNDSHNSPSRSEHHHHHPQQSHQPFRPVPVEVAVSGVPDLHLRAVAVSGEEIVPGTRQRRHPCTMCHKKFDRPSTLKKHLLVHTGEKAYQCETCGRRFGVSSNLNRHVRKCVLKPVHALTRKSSSPNSDDTTDSHDQEQPHSWAETSPADRMTTTATLSVSPPAVATTSLRRRPSPSPPIASTINDRPPAKKRPRRAPTPIQWLPSSLHGFSLLPAECHDPVPVPLPPVSPSVYEERDSWDKNLGPTPYHPREWVKLPGPGVRTGLDGRDVRNLGGRGRRFGSAALTVAAVAGGGGGHGNAGGGVGSGGGGGLDGVAGVNVGTILVF